MKTVLRIPTLTLLALFGFVVPHSEAQIKTSSGVFGNGGNRVTGGNNQIAGTVGQAAIGVSNSASHSNQAGFWYQTVDLITSVEQITDDGLPTEFRLDQNYPNPFNPTTTIQFSVPKTSNVTIKIYDVIGRQVATLLDDEYQPGQYKVVFEAGQLASGLYIYRIQAGDFRETKKLMFLK